MCRNPEEHATLERHFPSGHQQRRGGALIRVTSLLVHNFLLVQECCLTVDQCIASVFTATWVVQILGTLSAQSIVECAFVEDSASIVDLVEVCVVPESHCTCFLSKNPTPRWWVRLRYNCGYDEHWWWRRIGSVCQQLTLTSDRNQVLFLWLVVCLLRVECRN